MRRVDIKAMKRNLRFLREGQRILVSDLAEGIGYDVKTVRAWENEKRMRVPHLDGLVALAEFYGVEPGDLIILTEV